MTMVPETTANTTASAPLTMHATAGSAAADVQHVAFVSLGCPKNLVDSEAMFGLVAADGLVPVSDEDHADAIVINTCGFLEASKEESLAVINDALARKRDGKLKRVVVAGCLVQRHREKILEWCPGVDALIGVYDRDHVVDAVRGAAAHTHPEAQDDSDTDGDGTGPQTATALDIIAAPGTTASPRPARPKRLSLGEASDRPAYWVNRNALAAAKERGMNVTGLTINGRTGTQGLGYFEHDGARLRLTPRHFAYLRISEGCNQNCTFCTIPSIRGRMRSKPVDRIVAEAFELMDDGAYELNLIGQDTTSFGEDIHYSAGLVGMLTALNDAVAEHTRLRAAGARPGGPAAAGGWLRLMYAYPSCFTDEMIDAIASLEHVVKYIDMPLQHINDRVLTSMRRHTSRHLIETLLHKLRERIPGMALRTTFITGFPGETEAEHEELCAFIEDFGFDMLGVFQYSPEPGTPAERLEQDHALRVPAEVKQRRYDELMSIQQQVAFEQADYLASLYRDHEPDLDDEADDEIPGLQFDVLIDRVDADTADTGDDFADFGFRRFVGRCYHQAPQVDSVTWVDTTNADVRPGDLVRCTIVDADGYDLIARPTAELEAERSTPER